MNTKFRLPLLAVITAGLSACASLHAPSSTARVDTTHINTQIRRLMQREAVNGLAVAIIEGGRVVHVAAYGHRNVERKLPLEPATVMYGASLTKTAFAYMMLQLVDEGRLNLDASIADLLPKPLPEYEGYASLRGDDRWRALTPRILLTHRSGFANLRFLEPDRQLRFHFTPGERYAYAGEGFYILQMIVEEGLKLDAGAEMQRRVFDRFGMKNTSMKWRADFANNLADGYALDGAFEPHDERSRVSAAGSMDTSIEDQAKMWAGIVRGEGLTPASRAELVRAHASITSAHQFPTLQAPHDSTYRHIGLAAGLGVITFEGKQGRTWFKGGHNDWTGNMVVCVERGQRCVVMLANDVRAERVYPEITQMVLGETGMPWRWEYGWAK
jgi:CubicO group peptidase (beta-lactamase class C family)